jgi:tetratricopeptide (TPR) repeat protein
MIYNANMDKGKQFIREALNKDPDNVTYQRTWKNIARMDKLKKEGTDLFAARSFPEAIEKFTECLDLDPLNHAYNSTLLFNRASAYG